MRYSIIACSLMLTVLISATPTWAQAQKLRAAHIEIKGSYPEGATADGLFGSVTESLAVGTGRLDAAANDVRIDAVILRLNNPTIGWAKLNEIRQSVQRVRSKGKKVYAWLDSATTMDYLIAASCDQVVMPESGVLMMTGMRAEVSFYKNLFDKLDVKAEMLRVGEFKSAAEPYTRTEMSPAFRLEMEELLDDHYKRLIETVATDRKLTRKQVIAAIDSGPHTAEAAHKLGLIDTIAYEDQLVGIVKGDNKTAKLIITRGYAKKKIDTDFSGIAGMMKLMTLMMGGNANSGLTDPRPKVAVIYATGTIMTGSSRTDFLSGSVLGGDTIIKAVQKANADDTVKAIVLRVDSPGGSALASDLMWRALEKVEKPFVVSMGDVAASGGYYIAMGADRIFAEPGTLTGSIGVVGGKFGLNGLFKKVGITTTVISRGKNSGVMSTLDGFSDSERAAMTKMLYAVYDQFTQKAAKGRNMKHADLEKLARGRVYTGSMALKVGLVDQLGTLDDAVKHAAKLAGMNPNNKIQRMVLPPAANPFESLLGPLGVSAKVRDANAAALIDSVRAIAPEAAQHLKAASMMQLLSREPRLTLMPFRLTVK
jgi:protease-4